LTYPNDHSRVFRVIRCNNSKLDIPTEDPLFQVREEGLIQTVRNGKMGTKPRGKSEERRAGSQMEVRIPETWLFHGSIMKAFLLKVKGERST